MQRSLLIVSFVGAMLLGTLVADDNERQNKKEVREFYKSLNLTKEQKASIKKIHKEHRDKMKAMRKDMKADVRSGKLTKEEAMSKMGETKMSMMSNKVAEVSAVLDDQQREKYMAHVKKKQEMWTKKQEIKKRHHEGMKPLKEQLEAATDEDEKQRLMAELETKWNAMVEELAALIEDPKEREQFIKNKKAMKEKRKGKNKQDKK